LYPATTCDSHKNLAFHSETGTTAAQRPRV